MMVLSVIFKEKEIEEKRIEMKRREEKRENKIEQEKGLKKVLKKK